MQISRARIEVNKIVLRIINKYMLDIENPFHVLAAKRISQEFDITKDKNYEIKLLNRMKLSLGREVHLNVKHSLFPRREPVYFKKVYPLNNALVIYGVDRMSNKDMN